MRELRCIHRHTIDEHPSCFANGKIKYNFKDSKEFERKVGIPWYDQTDENGKRLFKIGFFDIEVDDLKPDIGNVLSWAIKEREGNTIHSLITKEELFNEKFDERLIREFISAISNFNILVGYYSTNFDMSYMRAKSLYYGLDFPGFSLQKGYNGNFYNKAEIFHWDLYYIVRNKLHLSRNSLGNVTQYLGIEGKTPLDIRTWKKARFGNKKALGEVLFHNLEDVRITEQLWERLIPYKKWNRGGI